MSLIDLYFNLSDLGRFPARVHEGRETELHVFPYLHQFDEKNIVGANFAVILPTITEGRLISPGIGSFLRLSGNYSFDIEGNANFSYEKLWNDEIDQHMKVAREQRLNWLERQFVKRDLEIMAYGSIPTSHITSLVAPYINREIENSSELMRNRLAKVRERIFSVETTVDWPVLIKDADQVQAASEKLTDYLYGPIVEEENPDNVLFIADYNNKKK